MPNYKISPQGLDEIRKSESLLLNAYQDGGGVWTIGYGHTGKVNGVPVGQGMKITKEQAEQILRQDVGVFENAVRKHIKVPLNQNQFDALVNFSFDVGEGGVNGSTLARYLNQGNYQAAADQMLRWNKDNGKVVKGLTNRRARERAMFLGESDSSQSLEAMPVPTSVDEPIDAPIRTIPTISQPQIAPLTIGDQLAQQFAPAQINSGIESYFNQANGVLEPTQQSQPSNRQKYQAQLASAFGIQPEVKDGLPDYIGDLVKSIYDQA